MANKKDEQDKILSLGSLHEEVEKEEQKKKLLKLPLAFILAGIIFILIGTFYTNIVSFVESSTNLFKKKEPTKNVGQILKCSTKKNDTELGISTSTTITYHFEKDLLKTIEKNYLYQPLTNSSDIGSSNLAVYHEKYQAAIKKIGKFGGLKIDLDYKENKLNMYVEMNYEKIDTTTFPKNDIVSLDNSLNQTYREIKEIEGRAGHICTTK